MVTKLTLEYDGTDFIGWARQPGLRTVQEVLERALRTVLGEMAVTGAPLTLTVAGRTDRGVHAWKQVASYEHEAVDPRRLNALLGEDISILACEPAPAGFDARRDALSRTYCYRLLPRRPPSPFERRHALWWPGALDRDLLRECARALLGRHDFTAFTPTETDHVRFERDVLRAQWRTVPLRSQWPRDERAVRPGEHAGGMQAAGQGQAVGGGQAAGRGQVAGQGQGGGQVQGGGQREQAGSEELLEFWIEADTFMRHMNRIIVGTMLEVASHKRTLADFERLLEGRPRAHAGVTAPPHGLALASVAYPQAERGS